MTYVVIGMLLCLAAAVLVLVLVALPKLREGAPLLSEEGEDTVREARRRTRRLAARARMRARDAAGQAAGVAAERAAALRERAAGMRAPRDTEEPAAEAPAAEAPAAVAGDADGSAPDHVIDVRDTPIRAAREALLADDTDTDLRRGAHRPAGEHGWGDLSQGPRHGL